MSGAAVLLLALLCAGARAQDILADADNLVFQVNDGQHVSYRVGDESVNIDEIPSGLRDYTDATLAALRLGYAMGLQQASGGNDAELAALISSLADKADADDVYEKAQVDLKIATATASIMTQAATKLELDVAKSALQAQVDTKAASSALTATVGDVLALSSTVAAQPPTYNRAEVDSLLSVMESRLAAKTAALDEDRVREIAGEVFDERSANTCASVLKFASLAADGTILASQGIGSVTKTSTGTYTVTFDPPFENNEYAVATFSAYGGGAAAHASIQADDVSAGMEKYIRKDGLIVSVRSTSGTPTDVDIINVMAMGLPSVDCQRDAEKWVTFDGTTAEVHAKHRVGLVRVGPQCGCGFQLVWDPAYGSGAYVVVGSTNADSSGNFLGLEGNDLGNQYDVWSAAYGNIGSRYDGNQGNSRHAPFMSAIAFGPGSVFRAHEKWVRFTNSGSMMGQQGVQSVQRLAQGRFLITWTRAFATKNYAVFGLGNMWSTGGANLGLKDAASQFPDRVEVNSRLPNSGYGLADGDYYVVMAIGEEEA